MTVAAVLFIGGIVCGVIAWPSSRPGPAGTPASFARVPGFHATPRPAHATTIAVDFATRPRPGTGPASPQPSVVPFTQCAGAGRGCGELIQVTGAGAPHVMADPGTGPYDGSAATLIGVVNSSGGAIRSLRITADTGVFMFAKDGACSGRFAFFKPPRGCPYGPTGYEGPGISFTGVNGPGTAGSVSFGMPLAPGRTAWFSLAQALEATSVAGDNPPPSAAEQGGAPNPAEHQAACSPEPVNCATGALWQEFPGFSLPGRGVPLSLARTYVSAAAATSSAFGYGWTDNYAMRLRRGPAGTRTVIQEDGAAATFTPNASGGYTAPSRVTGWLARNQDGTFTFARYGSRVQFHFDGADGKLVSETDANENLTQLSYNADGTLQTVKDVASGRALTLFYYPGGRVSRVSGPLGHGENYGYDGYGNLTSVSNDVRDTWKFGYDQPASHLLTSVQDPRGYATEITYRGNRVTAVSEPGQGTTTWSYSGNPATPAGGTTTERAPDHSGRPGGAVTTYEYRALELLAVTAGTGTPDAATTGYTYTTGTEGPGARAGLVASRTDPELNVTSYRYDQFGNLARVVKPLGKITTYAYGGGQFAQWGEVTQVTPPRPGRPQVYQYDPANGNLDQRVDGAGIITQYQYGGPNDSDLVKVTSTGGRGASLTYDSYGDIAALAIATGSGTDTTAFTYDADGELKCEVPPGGGANCPDPASDTHARGTQSFTYDSAGHQVTSTNPAGDVTTVTYDQDGDVHTVATPDRVITTYSYNAADEETREIARKPGDANPTLITTIGYYGDGLPKYQAAGPGTATGDTGASVSTDSYDILGRLKQVTNPLGLPTTYAYARDGELASVTNAAGQVSHYAYDAAGELTGTGYSDPGTPAVTYAYYPDGWLERMTDGTGVTIYQWDGAGRLLRAAHSGPSGAVPTRYSYQYLDSSNTTILTYPNGGQVTSTYNQAGQLVKVADWLGNPVSFSYAPGGALNKETFPGGVEVADVPAGNAAATADTLKVTQGGTSLASFTDTRDPVGRLSSAAATGVPGSPASTRYSYDAAGQLTSAGSAWFTYDPAGNLTTAPGGGTQDFNAAGELQPAGAYGYDKRGELTAVLAADGASQRMTYNQAGELTGYQRGPVTARYDYDGAGLRASKTVGAARTDYTWDLAGSAPRLLAAGSTSYIYGPDGQPVEQVTGSKATYLIADQQGNTRLLASPAGAVTGGYSYSPYGTVSYSCMSKGAGHCAATALRYGGQYTDSESGYLYLAGRMYNPSTGQFLTASPATGRGQSPYAYADDDPVNASFTGLSWAPVASHPNPWNPASWGWKQWLIGVGAGAVIVAVTIATAGADLPFLGGAAAGSAAGVTEGAAEGAAIGTSVGTAEGASIAAGTDVATAEGTTVGTEAGVSTEAGAGGAGGGTGARILKWLTVGSVVWGVIKFIIDAVQAGNTCADPNKSTRQCATSAAEAFQSAINAARSIRNA